MQCRSLAFADVLVELVPPVEHVDGQVLGVHQPPT